MHSVGYRAVLAVLMALAVGGCGGSGDSSSEQRGVATSTDSSTAASVNVAAPSSGPTSVAGSSAVQSRNVVAFSGPGLGQRSGSGGGVTAGRTASFPLDADSSVVTLSVEQSAAGCNWAASLIPIDHDEEIVLGGGPGDNSGGYVRPTTVTGGVYAFEVDTSCPWQMTVAPAP